VGTKKKTKELMKSPHTLRSFSFSILDNGPVKCVEYPTVLQKGQLQEKMRPRKKRRGKKKKKEIEQSKKFFLFFFFLEEQFGFFLPNRREKGSKKTDAKGGKGKREIH
jgi:hypothetical protein